MKMPHSSRYLNILLPHISRIFSAKWFLFVKQTVFVLAGVGFFVVNILYSTYVPQPFISYRQAILAHPFSIQPYVQFGQALFRQGNITSANEQVALASNLTNTHVLGAQTDLHIVTSQWEHELSKQERLYTYWKHIVEANPDYRDGFVQLALISYDMKRIDEAMLYLQRAQELDPNNPIIGEILQQIQ